MAWMVFSLFAGAAAAPIVYRVARGHAGWLLALLALAIVWWSSQFWDAVGLGSTERETYLWVPSLGVHATFYLDGLALVFLLLICSIGALILLYASEYLRDDNRLGLFYSYLLLFMGSMLGLVLADNVFVLFMFWELTSISSFLLIGWSHLKAESREAARTSLIVTGGGGMMLLGGVVLLALMGGSTDISRLSGEAVQVETMTRPTSIGSTPNSLSRWMNCGGGGLASDVSLRVAGS